VLNKSVIRVVVDQIIQADQKSKNSKQQTNNGFTYPQNGHLSQSYKRSQKAILQFGHANEKPPEGGFAILGGPGRNRLGLEDV
jgi:hypothetical protein